MIEATPIEAILVGGPRHGHRIDTYDIPVLQFLDNEARPVLYHRAKTLDLMYLPDGKPAVFTAPTVRTHQVRQQVTDQQLVTYRGFDLMELVRREMRRTAVRLALEHMPISRGMWVERDRKVDGVHIIELNWLSDDTVDNPHADWTEVVQRLGYERARAALTRGE